jgi:hypothetical protein
MLWITTNDPSLAKEMKVWHTQICSFNLSYCTLPSRQAKCTVTIRSWHSIPSLAIQGRQIPRRSMQSESPQTTDLPPDTQPKKSLVLFQRNSHQSQLHSFRTLYGFNVTCFGSYMRSHHQADKTQQKNYITLEMLMTLCPSMTRAPLAYIMLLEFRSVHPSLTLSIRRAFKL